MPEHASSDSRGSAETMAPLDGTYRVIDLTSGIAGAYCTKILADGGAEVICVEPPTGNPLRAHSASGAPVDDTYGGVLYQFLSCSKSSVVADLDLPEDLEMVLRLVSGADAVVWNQESELCRHPSLSPSALRAHAPHVTVTAITPFGLDNPWSHRAANEFTLQALTGTAWGHGPTDAAPVYFAGDHADWGIGTAAAFGLLIARMRTMRTGEGELIDLAGLDVLHLTHVMFPVTFFKLTGRPHRTIRSDNIPGAHPAKDGWVGLWVTTGQQWLDFCMMVGREDWYEDKSLGLMDNRAMRNAELVDHIDGWCAERTVEEIVDLAAAMRIPVTPMGDGKTLPTIDHFIERQMFTAHPRTGVTQPDVWYRFNNGAGRRPFVASPGLGEHTERFRSAELTPLTPKPAEGSSGDGLWVLDDLRVADMTAYWAGPIIAHLFTFFGADIIHVESTKRPDGIRMAATVPMSQDGWWETSPFFSGTNTNKRDLAIDLQTPEGRAVMLDLIAHCDMLVENFSPRVMGQLGLDYESLTKIRPDLIMLRGPAFGTSGPWTDRVAYAPIIDQASGLSWVTGLPEGRPSAIGAASDALGGMHGTIALLLALEYRRRTGKGMLIESPQIGPALNYAAEQVLEYSAHGLLLQRQGNRSWTTAPQGAYRCLDRDRSPLPMPSDDWVVISVDTEPQWQALCAVIGRPDLASDPSLGDHRGRKAEHDRIDEAITAWTSIRGSREAATTLSEAGVPAAAAYTPDELDQIEAVKARGLYEVVHNPVAGDMTIIGLPVGFEHRPDKWGRRHAPLLGEHNRVILSDLLGRSDEEIDALEASGIIGTSTALNLGW